MFDWLKPKNRSNTNPHEVQLKQTVTTRPVRLTLYDDNGKSIEIDAGDKEYWVGKGYTETPTTTEDLIEEVLQLADAFRFNANEFYANAVQDGTISRNDSAVLVAATFALNELIDKWAKLQAALYATYPVAEDNPIILVDSAGKEHRIDPKQVEHYKKAYGLKSLEEK